jgi:hypothetical protein
MKNKHLQSAPEWKEGLDEIERFWNESNRVRDCARLEDVIFLANNGKFVKGSVSLDKQLIEIRIKPETMETGAEWTEAYLLLGNYIFLFDDRAREISKVYAFGKARSDGSVSVLDKLVANERLKVDFKRLKAARIEIEEVYFEEDSQ